MDMKASDICDRWTILRMKARLDKDAEQELKLFEDAFLGLFFDYESNHLIMFDVMTLMEANARIWENEAAIRRESTKDPSTGKELDLAEIGRRALIIRDFNKLRVAAKQSLDKAFNQLPDNKVDHASQ